MDRPDILLDHEQRISTIEGVVTQINHRLESIDRRLDTLEGRLFWMWGSTMLVMVPGFAGLIADRLF